MSASGLDAHLAACPDCARWEAEAVRLTRQARLSTLAVPDLADSITTDVVLPTRRVLRRRLLLRLALVLVGFVQLGIAIPQIAGTGVGMAMSEHAAHEGAAWSIAIAVAFLAAAMTPRRAAGLVPLLATFIVVLVVLSIHDFAAGAVPLDRLLTHIAALAGLLLLIAIDRAERALPPWRFDSGERPETQHKLRGVA
jgi:predicted anti-sigma-YlaC factor YlaD